MLENVKHPAIGLAKLILHFKTVTGATIMGLTSRLHSFDIANPKYNGSFKAAFTDFLSLSERLADAGSPVETYQTNMILVRSLKKVYILKTFIAILEADDKNPIKVLPTRGLVNRITSYLATNGGDTFRMQNKQVKTIKVNDFHNKNCVDST